MPKKSLVIQGAIRWYMHGAVLLFISIASSCSGFSGSKNNVQLAASTFPATTHYNLSQPHLVKLPAELDEISGIFFYAKDSSLFAIMDEYGILYKISISKDQTAINKWKFGVPDDYEELVMIGQSFYVLVSTGNILKIDFDKDAVLVKKYQFPEKGNEFEAMYYEPFSGLLRLVCKDCPKDNKSTLSTYTFNPETGAYNAQTFAIDVKSIAAQANVSKMKFKPSGAAFNSSTNEVYLISSINKLLVILDTAGRIKSLYPLDPKIYKQPEGIALTDRNTLIISNEAADIGASNLLFFKDRTKALAE